MTMMQIFKILFLVKNKIQHYLSNNYQIISVVFFLFILVMLLKARFYRNFPYIILREPLINYVYFKSFFIISLLLSIYWLFIILFQKKTNQNLVLNYISNKYLVLIYTKLQEYFILFCKPFIYIFVILKNSFIAGYGMLFQIIGLEYTYKLIDIAAIVPKYRQHYLKIITVIEIIPRVIILCIFIVEIYNKSLCYYFISLLLLGIPLIFRFFIFMLEDLGPRLTERFKEPLIIEKPQPCNISSSDNKEHILIPIRLKPEFVNELDLELYLNKFYYPIIFITPEIELWYKPLAYKIKKFALLIFYLIHVFGWGFILYYY